MRATDRQTETERDREKQRQTETERDRDREAERGEIIIIIIDNYCIALFSGVPKLTALYNILQHFLSFTNIIHIIMTTNNV